ncbi:hypothetical protein Cgig2_026513 [Carnegiea gigantea]|uniref:NAD-dependent epimerase/dehydratase n=1 Tax=Carnegiea gigantea TaxID=171969 RepID=A0A9Q1KE87_9CARY|nr:hypothetical protein Cgig2_026513 [Carnegiea gigantea]
MELCSLPAAQFPATTAGFQRKFRAWKSPTIRILQSSAFAASDTRIKSQIDGYNCNHPSNRMFILGMGYVGQFFAQQLMNDGWSVSGTCMNIKKKEELEQKGFNVHVFDACEPEWRILDILRCYTHLLISIPPVEGIGDSANSKIEISYEEKIWNILPDLHFEKILALAGIYGDSEGAWVDEDYLPKPSSKLGKMRLDAEEGWLKLGQDLGLSSYVFRLAGIYGPGRSAVDTILKKKPLSEGQKRRATRTFTSRVHVADICQALKATISTRHQSKIYNVVDDDPASRAEVFAFALELIERKWPGLIDPAAFSIDTTQPNRGHKRVSNARIKKELGVRLFYPSYRSGLQSIIDHMKDPI